LQRIATVVLDAVAGLFGDERGCDHDAAQLLGGEVAVQPVAAGTGFVDEDGLVGFGLHLADELVDVALAGADGAEIGGLVVAVFADVGHGNRIFVDVQTDKESGRVFHG
jgi:hypothetical protein